VITGSFQDIQILEASGADKKIISPPGTKPGGNYSPGISLDGPLRPAVVVAGLLGPGSIEIAVTARK
jgi:hypothetical protein